MDTDYKLSQLDGNDAYYGHPCTHITPRKPIMDTPVHLGLTFVSKWMI
jgi:hypothetical protein